MSIFNIPNLITLGRVFLIPIIIYYSVFMEGRPEYVVIGLFGLFLLSDLLDGIVARRLGQVTEFGKAFDTIADKMLYYPLIVFLVVFRDLPAWFVIALIVKECFSIYIAIRYIRAMGKVQSAMLYGKVYINLTSLSVLAFIINVRVIFYPLAILALIFGYYSLTVYYRAMMKDFREGAL